MNASISTENREYWHLVSSKSFGTLETENYVPQMISNDTIEVDYVPIINQNALIARITWEPTAGKLIRSNSWIEQWKSCNDNSEMFSDMICGYLFALYATKQSTYEHYIRHLQVWDYAIECIHHSIEIFPPFCLLLFLFFFFFFTKPNELYHVISDELEYNMSYTLEINGFNDKNETIEGNKTIFRFTTPTCWEINNLQNCRKRWKQQTPKLFFMFFKNITFFR